MGEDILCNDSVELTVKSKRWLIDCPQTSPYTMSFPLCDGDQIHGCVYPECYPSQPFEFVQLTTVVTRQLQYRFPFTAAHVLLHSFCQPSKILAQRPTGTGLIQVVGEQRGAIDEVGQLRMGAVKATIKTKGIGWLDERGVFGE